MRKAYWTAWIVMWSYVRLFFWSKLWGDKWMQKRMIPLHLKNAERVKNAILELQGLFIKVGQLLSILSNFLPEAFQKPLEALQDKIPARPFSEIKQRIIAELGQPPESLFAHFDTTPIAAASIGQAHRAKLKDGTDVVVKIQHTNVEKTAEVDLTIMENLIYLISKFFNIKGLDYAYTQVRQMIEEELDFIQEAKAMQAIAAQMESEVGLKIPAVIPQFSTQRVLTTIFCEGVKISDVAQLDAWGINRRELADRLVHAFCQMVFENGFYHADPHPGNILVQADGTLVLLDFGAVATLKAEMRTGLLELINGAVKNDTDKIIAALQMMGFIQNDKNATELAEKVIDAFRSFLQNEVQFEGLNLTDIKINPFDSSLVSLITEIGIRDIAETVQVPKDYVLLNRMLTLLLGICNTLDSHSNPLDVMRPYFQKFLLGEKGEWVKFVTTLFQQMATSVLALPNDLHKTLTLMQKGELEVQIVGIKQQTQLLYLMGQQFMYVLLMLASVGFGYILYSAGNVDMSYYGFGFGAFFGILWVRVLRKGGHIFRKL